ncbi:LysM-like peptidoglycan-binding domain-containing protein [Erwinia sp. MMLR14_017]|uniref:OapA family protein n=1 Tax=Erwinia sp. MMLR14_017 TaxID=3093842 RepID=UPI0029905573|nr:LysM-like peptidoglycan-binding domain-containing protein [Erwinia sp. MMLR14_017]MDW8844494.1 LysM-like peptidoglycan-binding domain-containing protein [Erwinia sp. MMLR14_017]
MPKASSSSRIPQLFSWIWHLPESVRWMDPLPPFHRRGIILSLLVMLLAFLWPAPSPQRPAMTSGHSSETSIPMQAELSSEQPEAPTQRPSTPAPSANDSQGTWHNYQIAAGQTLAQLFRDNNLSVNDVFAMARVEGDDKPLSNLQTGQAVRIRQNAQGVVNGLTVDTDNGQILFTRQPDGSFVRAQ